MISSPVPVRGGILNNKKLGTSFERELCELLRQDGYWVHFLEPNMTGAQPFDIIAVKDGIAVAIDCKTCADHVFRLKRLEDNQVSAFKLWEKRGNRTPYIAVLYDEHIYWISFDLLVAKGKVDLREVTPWR